MQIVFQGVVPKELDYPDNNEDACIIDNNVVAISDGASESFDAKNWAKIITRKFASHAQFEESWLIDAIKEFSVLYNREDLSWAKQAAFDRGSFASLLGVEFHKESNSIEVLAIGDSIAVLINNGSFDKSYPYTSAEEFNQKPTLLSTNHSLNDFIYRQDFFSTHLVTWNLQSHINPLLLCMTDALGQWLLRTVLSKPNAIEALLSLRNQLELTEFILALRSKKEIRTDDTTLLIIDING